MRWLILLAIMVGCSRGLPLDSHDECALELTSPVSLHLEAPRSPPCAGLACEVPAWCSDTEFFSKSSYGSLFVQVGDRVSFDLPDYVCSTVLSDASTRVGSNVTLRLRCSSDTHADFAVTGSLAF